MSSFFKSGKGVESPNKPRDTAALKADRERRNTRSETRNAVSSATREQVLGTQFEKSAVVEIQDRMKMLELKIAEAKSREVSSDFPSDQRLSLEKQLKILEGRLAEETMPKSQESGSKRSERRVENDMGGHETRSLPGDRMTTSHGDRLRATQEQKDLNDVLDGLSPKGMNVSASDLLAVREMLKQQETNASHKGWANRGTRRVGGALKADGTERTPGGLAGGREFARAAQESVAKGRQDLKHELPQGKSFLDTLKSAGSAVSKVLNTEINLGIGDAVRKVGNTTLEKAGLNYSSNESIQDQLGITNEQIRGASKQAGEVQPRTPLSAREQGQYNQDSMRDLATPDRIDPRSHQEMYANTSPADRLRAVADDQAELRRMNGLSTETRTASEIADEQAQFDQWAKQTLGKKSFGDRMKSFFGFSGSEKPKDKSIDENSKQKAA